MTNSRVRPEEAAFEKGYRVTREGAVIGISGVVLKAWKSHTGYLEFTHVRGRRKTRVHRLQAYQKFGERIYEEGLEVRHLDGNRLNNHEDNIELGTHTDNMRDRSPEERFATSMKAARHRRKLSSEDVLEMRKLSAAGATGKALAELYGVSKGTVSDILSGKQRIYDGAPGTPAKTEETLEMPTEQKKFLVPLSAVDVNDVLWVIENHLESVGNLEGFPAENAVINLRVIAARLAPFLVQDALENEDEHV